MKIRYHFEIMDLDDGLVAVPVGDQSHQFPGVLKVNETGAAILKCLEKDTTEAQIVEDLLTEYAGDKAQIADYVHEFIETLKAESVVE